MNKKNFSSTMDPCLPGREWYFQQQIKAKQFIEEHASAKLKPMLLHYSEPAAVPVQLVKEFAKELDPLDYPLIYLLNIGIGSLRFTYHDFQSMQKEIENRFG